MPEKRTEFPLELQLRNDMREAMKARDQVKVDTLRMAMAAVRNLEVARTDRKNAEYGQPMTANDILRVLEQEIKKRSQAIALYEQGGRADLVDKEKREAEILQSYLHGSQLSDDEIRSLVSSLVEQHGKDFRKIMPLTIKETKGRADGTHVQKIVRELTQ